MSEVAVTGIGLFLPGFAGVPAYLAGAQDEASAAPKGMLVPARERRRMSVLTKALADAYGEALASSGADPALVSSVFGSALGEAATMIGLLDQMWSEEGALSPMRFVMSVHNAASGVVSVATQNRGFTTSLGADFDTPAMALAEGIGLVLARNEPVVVCCGDEAAPSDLVREGGGWELLAAAIALAPVASAPDKPRLTGLTVRAEPTVPRADVDPRVARNPDVGLLDLVDALARGRRGVVALDRGHGQAWSVTVVDPT